MNEIKIKHTILEYIEKFRKTDIKTISINLNLDLNICYSLCKKIKDDSYIDFIDTSTKDGKDALVSINGNGEIFLKNGGYLEEEKKIKIKNKQKGRRKRVSLISSIILTITSVASIVLMIIVILQNRQIAKLENKSANETNEKTKQVLIGSWSSKSELDYSKYIFNDDNTWEHILINYKNDTLITKGEYCIGKENGIFLRSYGTMHWGYTDDYTDYKSGLGTYYLFIMDTLLLNNQEDYLNKYHKIKN